MSHASLPRMIFATLLLAACDGPAADDGDGGETSGELSHAADIQPIWDANCMTGCHSAGGIGMPLDLTDGYAAIVDKPSSQAAGVDWVKSGSSADSYLVAKLRGTHLDLGGTGVQMPKGKNPLDEATISTIEAWIDAGAAP